MYKMWYRQQYVSGVCNVCKIYVNPSEVVRCDGCNLMTYCNTNHKDEDFDEHLEICDTLASLSENLDVPHILEKAYLLGEDAYREFRCGLVSVCSKALGRPLEPWEQELCLFPPVCVTCHRFNNLETCPICFSVSWCCPAHKPLNHDYYCEYLRLFIDILRQTLRDVPIPLMTHVPSSMKDLSMKCSVKSALLSEIASCPLSILEALNSLPQELNNSRISIHIVGPEPSFELSNLRKWEDFLFNFISKDLSLHFIGPELVILPSKSIVKNNRELTYTFKNSLYHDCSMEDKPTLIAAFNPGLYRKTGFSGSDTWDDTITTMFGTGAPVLVTSYTEKEIIADLKRIKSQVKNLKEILPISKNPFSSNRPLRNFVSDEFSPIVFKNFYRMLLKA